MLNAKDLELLAAKGISEKQIEEQLACFVKGFPFLEITASASVERGIVVIPQEKQATYMDAWDAYLAKNKKIVKFVPASGAASRMFKNLYEFLSADYNEPQNAFEKKFFDDIRKFAFYDALNRACIENEAKDIPALIALGQYKAVVSNLLESKGLNYGQLPKGLLLFHSYPQTARTAMEEHLAEGAMYAKNNAGEVNIHFTVSPEHKALFEQLVAAKTGDYEEKFSVKYDISFSVQKPSTDTIAADMENNPFRDKNGNLLFRPGGHGALIENLNDVDADVVFVKNIDNVVPDSFKCSTVIFKKVIAGVLVSLQERIFKYLELIDSGKYSHDQVEEMIHFLQEELCVKNPETKLLEDAELILYIKSKLNRPLRVCGMVKNVGEALEGMMFDPVRPLYRWAIKTNVAYLAATVANLGVEYSFGDHYSIDLPIIYSPYTVARDYRLRFLAVQPEFRYWLKAPMKGHFFGVHLNIGAFNIAVDNKNRYQSPDGFYGVGLSYGYVLPFARHWAAEFTVGAGYVHTKYDTYYNIPNGARFEKGRAYNYWGLTKVGINLLYRFGK